MSILEVRNLCKKREHFELRDVSFTIESGYITGFIGRNGAGKTTTIKSMLNLTKPDSGSVHAFNMDMLAHEIECKQHMGIVLGEFGYYQDKRLRQITKVISRFYDEWDQNVYNEYLARFDLDERKRVKELSAGMKVKYALALALSHNAKLLILDEPTSGLDPVSRDEIMDIFRRVVENGERSILFSTHITSDLDKCADYIIYIKDGSIIMNGDRESIINGYRLVQGGREELTAALQSALVGLKETAFGFTGLISVNDMYLAEGLQTAKADIESIMLYTEKEGLA
ncbi:MAG: ABC transporter ATP-binding protein [Christensenellaceae bacterium]|nr:ABC transporter ATP-binding protein [Christensenellaceae bacterium]